MMLLEANDVKISVQDRLLVDVRMLGIYKNDRIGLVGRNGSGKTSLLQVLAGKTEPEEGVVTIRATSELLPQLKHQDSVKSGGEVTQEYINEVFTKNPAILFADEPTTNLDTTHIEWVEKKLSVWKGALVIVSHDRAFLDALCTTIWEIDEGRLSIYKGNYSDYVKQKEEQKRQQEIAYEKYEKKKKQLEEAAKLKEKKANRATKAPKSVSPSEAKITGAKPYFAKKQKKLQQTVKAMETRIDKLEKVEKVKEATPIKMNLPNEAVFKGRTIVRAVEVPGMIGRRVLWEPASFHIRGGDKVAIIGPNGSGKTTLIKKMIHQKEGITLSPSMKIGYFSQNLSILDSQRTVLENVSVTSKQDETLIRTVLARLRFFRDDVHKPVGVLSGGERVKVALAKLFVSDINTLILDEPTNFLDTEAVEALESLLIEYEGTVIFVSHDRQFIENVATRILAIDEKKIEVFEGTFAEYKRQVQAQSRDTTEDQRLVIETKLSEVLSKLSLEPSEELEREFQKLLQEKRRLENTT
ncbi:Vga family ABC-F type ribosomal protection protein [Aneurinibacillus sp. REN35]|uniref:Vga family ABC-F type ribosomal protection protein n=1 Tax=Aneurinibacillus sp. REN35 TaxID=3237286 RepID=UPI00352701C3